MAHVMIVDDDESFLYVIERELRAVGHETVTFHDWAGVLETLEGEHPLDLLLVDLRLPAGTPNGLSLARLARARRPGLRVVYMTAFANLALEVRAILPSVVVKGDDPQRLLEAVAAALAA